MIRDFESVRNATFCPISGLHRFLTTDYHAEFPKLDYAMKDSKLMLTIGSPVHRVLVALPCPKFENQTCATVPQAGIVNGFYQDLIEQAYRPDDDRKSRRLEAYQALQKNYYQPYTAASCVVDVVIDGSVEVPLRFPRISETTSDLQKDRDIVSIPGLTRGQIIDNVSGDHSRFRVQWIDLPQNSFKTGIPGAVVVNPQGLNGPPYNIYQCTFDAGWGASALMTDSEYYNLIISHRIIGPLLGKDPVYFDPLGYIRTSSPDFTNISSRPFPERRISVSENWMKFLNPTLVLADNATTTYISRYLSLITSPVEEMHVERMFACLLSVALSSTGEELAWRGIYEHIVKLDNSRC